MSEMEEQGGSTASPPNAEDRLRELGMQLKQYIEYKEWDALEQLLTIPSVWVIDRNMPVVEAVGRMRSFLGPAADIQLTLDRVTRMNIAADEANVSLVVRLVWSESETWAEHEELVEMHLGFRCQNEDWAFSSLGFTAIDRVPAEQAETGAPEATAADVRNDVPADARYLEGFADFGDFTDFFGRLWKQWPYWWKRQPFPVPSPYFAAPPFAAEAAEVEAAPAAAPPARTHAMVYMPVFVPSELLDQYLPK